MRIQTRFSSHSSPEKFGDLLFDLSNDPGQLSPIRDDETELRMANAIRSCMLDHDAPDELYIRYRLSKDHEITPEEYAAEREKLDWLTFPGMEGYLVHREVYAALGPIKGYSAEYFPQMASGLCAMADAMGTKQISKDMLIQFVQQLPLADDLKQALLSTI